MLDDLTVLVTRPKPAGEILCKKIKALNGRVIYLPAIVIHPPADVELFKQQISTLNQYDWLIFISPQSVYQSIGAIHSAWKTLPSHLKVAAIGLSTAQALVQNKVPIATYPITDWRSEGLLKLPQFIQIMGKKIAIICGAGGRELLAEELSNRGALITFIVAYQRKLPQVAMQEYLPLLPEIDIIVCTSNEILQNLKKLFASVWDEFSTIPVIVVSERMLGFANDLGFKKRILAKNASHEAIMAILTQEKESLCQMKKKK